MGIKHILRHIDYTLVVAVLALAVLGIFMIYAATNADAIPPLIARHRRRDVPVPAPIHAAHHSPEGGHSNGRPSL